MNIRATLISLLIIVLPSIVLGQGGRGAAQAVPTGAGTTPEEPAKVFYAEANSLYYRGKFAEALDKYQQAYMFDPNPSLKFNICKTMEKLKQAEAAGTCYQEYIAQYPTDNGVGYAQSFLDDAAAAKPPAVPSAPASAPAPASPPASEPAPILQGTLIFKNVPTNSTVKVDNIEIAPSGIAKGEPLWLNPGPHSVTVTDPKGIVIGKGPAQVDKGQLTTWVFVPVEEPGFMTTQKWWAVGAAGGAAVGIVLTGIFAGQMSTASDEATGGQFDFAAKDRWSEARTRTYISIGATTALLGTATALWFLDTPAPPRGKVAGSFTASPTGFTIHW